MVKDANGQYSVSYLDMHGRTIATALAGNVPDSIKLDKLGSNGGGDFLTLTLTNPNATTIKDMTMENKSSLLVNTAGLHEFSYSLDASMLKLQSCSLDSICYDCLYDLQITISDDCNNQNMPGGKMFDTSFRNFSFADIDTMCNPAGFAINFSLFLNEGNYEVTKKLTVSKYGKSYYRDSIFLKKHACKTLQQFIKEQRDILLGKTECNPTCASCLTALGTWDSFRSNYMTIAGIASVDSAQHRTEAWNAYNRQKESCDLLCGKQSDVQDIRKSMLADMTGPSGQYANPDSVDSYSVFFRNTDTTIKPIYQRDTIYYRDNAGNPVLVYDDSTGVYVCPQKLSPIQFASKFQPEWAEALLKMHPEYCKLVEYEKYNAALEWNRKFEAVDTYREALAAGYLNPTNNTSIGPFNNYPGNSLNKDPLSVTLAGILEQTLSDGVSGLNLWQLAIAMVHCSQTDNSCYVNVMSMENAFDSTQICFGELDMAWRNFRQIYLIRKRELINEQISSVCTVDVDGLKNAGHFLNFPKDINSELIENGLGYASDPSQGTVTLDSVKSKAQENYDANCRSYVKLWVQQLAPCNYDSIALNSIIIPKLIQVCKQGSDQYHPNGSSTVDPKNTTASYRSFEDVIREYNQQHGITDALRCNAELITAPKPFDQQVAFSDYPIWTKPDSCQCASIKRQYQQYLIEGDSSFSAYLLRTQNTKISDQELTMLRSMCDSSNSCNYLENPINLPPALQCGTGDICIDCNKMNTLYNEYQNKYPGNIPLITESDSLQLAKNKLFENFMNNRLGFSKQAFEYLDFMKSCALYNSDCDSFSKTVADFDCHFKSLQNPVVHTGMCNQHYWNIQMSNGYDSTSTFYVSDKLDELLSNGVLHLPQKHDSLYLDFFNYVPYRTIAVNNEYSIEIRLKAPNLKNGLPVTAGDLQITVGNHSINTPSSLSDEDFSGAFTSGCSCGYYEYRGVRYADTAFNNKNFEDWHILKYVVKPAYFRILMDGIVIKQIDRDGNSYIDKIGQIQLKAYGTTEAQIDWLKIYKADSVLVMQEDFNDVNSMARPDTNHLVPVPDCQTAFVAYYNNTHKTNYTFFQLDSLHFKKCGTWLNVCDSNDSSVATPSISCVNNQRILDEFNCIKATLGDTILNPYSCRGYWSFDAEYVNDDSGYVVNDATNLFSNNMINVNSSLVNHTSTGGIWGDPTLRNPIRVSYKVLPGLCINNGYSTEFTSYWTDTYFEGIGFRASVKSNNDSHYDSENFYFELKVRNRSIADEDTVICRYRGNQYKFAAGYCYENNVITKFKLVVTASEYQVFIRDTLRASVQRDGHSTIYALTGLHFYGQNTHAFFHFDDVKLWNESNSLMYAEDFNNLPYLSKPSSAYVCANQTCSSVFEDFYHLASADYSFTEPDDNKRYNIQQIISSYQNCYLNISPCNNYSNNSGLYLCGKSAPVFTPTGVKDINNCSDSTFISVSVGSELHKSYMDSLTNVFDSLYRNKCLQAYKHERFTVKSKSNEYHYTLYYYDQAGNLVKTVPPAGVNVIRRKSWTDSVETALKNNQVLVPSHKMTTDYRYNTLNQVIAQNTPDAGISQFWYDRLGRLAVSQNAQQKKDKKYSYTWYDALGRITEVGQKPVATDTMSIAIARDNEQLQSFIYTSGGTREQITKTVYDAEYAAFNVYSSPLRAKNLRNRVAYSQVWNYATDILHQTATYYSYDIHGNVDTLLQDYAAGNMHDSYNRFKKIVYKYDLISGKVNLVSYQPNMPDQFFHRYYYDAENRVTDVETSKDSIYWDADAHYSYYLHGPLNRTLVGQQQVQGIDYAYTLQGWLKGINSTALTPAKDMGGDANGSSPVAKDVYGFALHYYGARDYTSIISSSTVKPFAEGGAAGFGFKALYNGNIAGMSVNIARLSEPLLYTYTYDQLNRLTKVFTYRNLNVTTNSWNANAVQDYRETLSYDANGNILSLNRNGNTLFGGTSLNMDDLKYRYYYLNTSNILKSYNPLTALPADYKEPTNKLAYVTDNVNYSNNYNLDIDNQSDNNYDYDAIGNLIKDNAEKIKNINWNVYGKIASIEKFQNGGSGTYFIRYTYDAAGNRISKVFDSAGIQNYTYYVRDASGNVMAVYIKNGSYDLVLSERYLYGSNRLGVYNNVVNVQNIASFNYSYLPNLGTGYIDSFKRGYKNYELVNHLGNVLATITDKKIGVDVNNDGQIDNWNADIQTAQDYYSGGMLMPGRKYSAGNLYRYGFNGKENDNEVKGEGNQQDYGMRIYDPRLGKFLSVDPLTSKYAMLTPYQFASNTPIQAIDIDGKEAWVIITNHIGNSTKIKMVFDKDLKNPGGVYAIHRWMDPGSDFVKSQSSGSYDYSNYKQYFPNFSAGNHNGFSFSKFRNSFSLNGEGNILFGEAGVEGEFVGAKLGGSFGMEGKLIGIKIGSDNVDFNKGDYNPVGFNSTFKKNDRHLNVGGGLSYLAGMSYRQKFDIDKGSFEDDNSISYNGVVTSGEINAYQQQAYLSWGVGGKLALGLGINFDLKFKINMAKLGESIKALSTKFTTQETQELEATKAGTKDFDPNNY